MPMYPRIPDPPIADPLDSAASYGLTLLAFVVRERVTVTLSDEQIALALHVAPIASACTVQISPDKVRTVDHRVQAADAVAEAVRDLSLTARLRERQRTQDASAAAPAAACTTAGPQPGSRVPRVPIAPTEPPAGNYADAPMHLHF